MKITYVKKAMDYLNPSADCSCYNWTDPKVVDQYYDSIGVDLSETKPQIDYSVLVQYILKNTNIVRDESGNMYIYCRKDGIYECYDDFNIGNITRFILNQGQISVFSKRVLNEVEAQIKSYSIRIVKSFDNGPCYTFKNQSYNVDEFTAEIFNPKNYNRLKMGYECNPACVEHPAFDKFLDDFTCGDDGLKLLLQEIVGYLFWPTNVAQRSFIMCGPARSGKSTMAELLKLLLGGTKQGAVISTPLNCLSTAFGLEGIDIAKAIITTESEKDEKVQTALYKAIVSGDSVSLNEKHQKRKTIEPRCKLISFTNHLPQFSEADPSLERRLLIFPCRANIPRDKVDTELINKLQAELPAIFNWAMKGLQKLKKSNWLFNETAETKSLVKDYTFTTDPMYQFISDVIATDDSGKFIKFCDLQREYISWARNNGHDYKINRFGATFTEHLESKNYKIEKSRQKGYDGVKGITLKQ